MSAYDVGAQIALEDLGFYKEAQGPSIEQLKQKAYRKQTGKPSASTGGSTSRFQQAMSKAVSKGTGKAQQRLRGMQAAKRLPPRSGSSSGSMGSKQAPPSQGSAESALGSGLAENARQAIMQRRARQRAALNM